MSLSFDYHGVCSGTALSGPKARPIVAARNVPGLQPFDSRPVATQPCGLGCDVADPSVLKDTSSEQTLWSFTDDAGLS
jgi:hypothetical protein